VGGEGVGVRSGCEGRGNLHGEPFTLFLTLFHQGALFVTPLWEISPNPSLPKRGDKRGL